MIPKPEILKSEVKEFIDAEPAFREMQIKESARLFFLYPKHIKEFYSQPFQPEMITEYFEGWRSNLNVNFSKMRGGKIRIINNAITFEPNDIQIPVMEFHLPKTLSQFITNCIQAGIKLTWKEK